MNEESTMQILEKKRTVHEIINVWEESNISSLYFPIK